MTLSIDQVLSDARRLVERLKDHDSSADHLIHQTTTLNKRVEAMKEYQEEIEEMNNIAHHRPRSALILGIQRENRQIRELQKENQELRVALEEHQSALDLIMSSYRDQVYRLVNANRMDRDNMQASQKQEESLSSLEKIIEMAAVMQRAINIDEQSSNYTEEALARLQLENRGLRELLQISQRTEARQMASFSSEGSSSVDLGNIGDESEKCETGTEKGPPSSHLDKNGVQKK